MSISQTYIFSRQILCAVYPTTSQCRLNYFLDINIYPRSHTINYPKSFMNCIFTLFIASNSNSLL